MQKRNHFIVVGRTSRIIAESIIGRYTDATIGPDGPVINEPTNVFQARFGTFGDGESIFELFVEGKLRDHPIEQNLSEKQKKKILQALRGSHVTIVHSISGENTSSRANSLLDGIYDLKKHYGVHSISLIAPHLPFMRNDRRFRKLQDDGTEVIQRNAVSCKTYARRLHSEGAEIVRGIEAHSRDGVKHYRKYFGGQVEFVNTGDFFARDFAASHALVDGSGEWLVAVGSPDGLNKAKDYGVARAKGFGLSLYANTAFSNHSQADHVRKIPYMFAIHKQRIDSNTTVVKEFHGQVEGKHSVLVDDIYSSGGTTIQGAKALKDHGAARISAIGTHAVLVDNALERLLSSDAIDTVYMTDTIPSAVEKAEALGLIGNDKLVFKSVSPMIVTEIESLHSRKMTWAYATGQIPKMVGPALVMAG